MIRPFKCLFLVLMVCVLSFFSPSIYAIETSNSMPIQQKISLDYKNADLTDVLKAISYSYGVNISVQKDIKGTVSAQLKDLTIDEALHAILSLNDYSYTRKGGVIYIVGKEDMEAVTESLPLRFLSLKEARTLLSGALPGFTGVIQESADSNNLVVTGNPADIERVKEALKGMDVSPIQVLIEAQIIDISRSDIESIDSAVGLIFTADQTQGSFAKYAPTIREATSDSISGGDQGEFGLTHTTKNTVTQASINALVKKNKARVLASPSIATLNGHEASIIIGEKFPYVTSTSTAGGVGGSVVNQTSTSYVDIGTKLNVTPRVSPDGWITMKILPEVSSVLGVTNGNPRIATRSAETEVRVKNNETIVIGGLKSKSDLRDRDGVPYLKDIPILGAIFQSHNTTLTDGELTVLITPHVMPMPEEQKLGNKVDLKSSFNYRDDAHLIENILNYTKSLEGDKTTDNVKNLYLSSEQIKSYRMVLRQFPDSGKSDFCLYKIALIYAKEFRNCDASTEALNELKDLDPASPYVPVTEALVNACKAVNKGSQ